MFSTSLLWAIFQIFFISRNTEIVIEWNHWLKMYVLYIFKGSSHFINVKKNN